MLLSLPKKVIEYDQEYQASAILHQYVLVSVSIYLWNVHIFWSDHVGVQHPLDEIRSLIYVG